MAEDCGADSKLLHVAENVFHHCSVSSKIVVPCRLENITPCLAGSKGSHTGVIILSRDVGIYVISPNSFVWIKGKMDLVLPFVVVHGIIVATPSSLTNNVDSPSLWCADELK